MEIGGRDGQLDALWKAFIERLAPANFGVRLAYSRTVIWAALLGALVVGGLSLWSWAFDQKAFLSAVGPGLFSAGLLATVAFALSRIRRR